MDENNLNNAINTNATPTQPNIPSTVATAQTTNPTVQPTSPTVQPTSQNVQPADPTAQPMDPAAQSANSADESLVQAYIGKNYEKISKNPFNIPAFFFAGPYLFYRKKVTWGIGVLAIYLILIIISNIVHNPAISTVFSTLIGVLCAFLFNKLYIKSIHKYIAKMRTENPNISIEELKGLCAAKGGTSVGLTVASVIVEAILIILTFVIMIAAGFANMFIQTMQNPNVSVDENGTMHISASTNDNNSGNSNNTSASEDDTDNEYTGWLAWDQNYEYTDVIDVVLPSEFAPDNSGSGYSYQPDGDMAQCGIEINLPVNFSDAQKMIQSMADYYADDGTESEVERYKKNGLTWYYFLIENSFTTDYTFASKVDGHIVLVQFSSDLDVANECEDYLWSVIDSVEAK